MNHPFHNPDPHPELWRHEFSWSEWEMYYRELVHQSSVLSVLLRCNSLSVFTKGWLLCENIAANNSTGEIIIVLLTFIQKLVLQRQILVWLQNNRFRLLGLMLLLLFLIDQRIFLGAKAPLGLVSVSQSVSNKKLEISKSRKIWTQNDIHWFPTVLYGPVRG